MLEKILETMQCGNVSLRPYVVMADESERVLEYSVSVNADAKTATISANDGCVSDYLFFTYSDGELLCRRTFENKSDSVVSIKELGVALEGISFGLNPRDDYFYHNENPRIYEAMTFPVDYDRTAADAKDSSFDIQAGNRWADPGVICERIGASPYQPFPAILLSNYQTNKGIVHGTLSQRVFYHNYLVSHAHNAVSLQVFSSAKATHHLDVKPGRVLYDEWYLGATEHADDIERIFENYTKVLRTKLPANFGSTKINRDNLVWGTWNDGIFRNVSEDMILREARYLKENFPTLRWIQLDDGYHTYGDLEAVGISVPYEGENGVDYNKFPNGLRHLTDEIRQIGLRPAVWIGLKVPTFTKLYLDHPEWHSDYSFRANFGVLDVSREDVREYMSHAANVLCRQYGFEAVKHDFWSYAFEDSHDLYSNKERSGYENRAWWLKEIRSALAPDGYFQTGCDIVMGNPFLGEYFTNYRYGIDIGGGNWDYVKTNYLWGAACFATHTGDLFVPNSDAIGLLPGLNDMDAMFCVNYCLVTHTMVEIAGKLSEAKEYDRLKVLRKATCNPNNGQDVFFAGYDYRCNHYSVPEVMYFKTPHFSVVENNSVLPLRTVGLFNVDEQEKTVGFTLSQLGLNAGEYILTDVWTGEQYTATDAFCAVLPAHGSRLLAVSKAGGMKLYDANVRVVDASVQDDVLTIQVDYAYKNAEFFFHAVPKAIACEGAELPFTVENGTVKLAVPEKGILKIMF